MTKCINSDLNVPPSGGSLEIGNEKARKLLSVSQDCSPFGGIPRNWKLIERGVNEGCIEAGVPPSGGSLEIGNVGARAIVNGNDRAGFPLRGDP